MYSTLFQNHFTSVVYKILYRVYSQKIENIYSVCNMVKIKEFCFIPAILLEVIFVVFVWFLFTSKVDSIVTIMDYTFIFPAYMGLKHTKISTGNTL